MNTDNMNFSTFCDEVAEQTGMTKVSAKKFVGDVFAKISENAKNNIGTTISEFGQFKVKSRDPRVGRNPATGAAVNIPASRAVSFSASKHLKEAVSLAKHAKKK